MLFSQHFYLKKETCRAVFFFWAGCNLQDDWVVWKSPAPVCSYTPRSWDKAVGKQLSGADKQKPMLSNKIRVSTWPEKQPNSPFVSQLSPKPCFRTMAFQILHSCDGLVNIHPQSDFPYVSKTTNWIFPSFFLPLFSQELLTSSITELRFPHCLPSSLTVRPFPFPCRWPGSHSTFRL